MFECGYLLLIFIIHDYSRPTQLVSSEPGPDPKSEPSAKTSD
jgi:hypothetical protein